MRESNFKTFVQQTYNSSSPLPYIITLPVALFVIVQIAGLISSSVSSSLLAHLSLPALWVEWIYQPWSLLTFPFIYTSLLSLIFDCLWLFWIGNMYLNLLNTKQFVFTFFGGLLSGGLVFLLVNTFSYFNPESTALSSMTFGITAILGSLILLSPKAEVRLFILGTVSLKIIAAIYIIIQLVFLVQHKEYAASIALLSAFGFGFFFIKSLTKGKDWSQLFTVSKKSHLKVVHRQNTGHTSIAKGETPNQELVDAILDKISASGYDSLNKKEKEILFRASKQE